ncbi:MAG: sulfatase-like hydrolase/transferase [Thermoplasmata archaeon]
MKTLDPPSLCRVSRAPKPDLLVIVLDCVGASALDEAAAGSASLPNLALLRKEALVFNHAVSPSSWSLPSHSGILTGLYPWDAGMTTSSSILRDSIETFTQIANRQGYRSGAFSSNPFITRENGLGRGFQVLEHGEFYETTFRRPPPKSDSMESNDGHSINRAGLTKRLHSLSGPYPGLLARELIRSLPVLIDVPVRAWTRIRSANGNQEPVVSPWIEPALARWIRAIPLSEPVFGFVNLMDAHEPYFGISANRPLHPHSSARWKALRSAFGHDGSNAVNDVVLDQEEADVLRSMHSSTIRIVDARIGAIFDILRDTGRFDDMGIVIVGDHGQTFGEAGDYFHGFGTSSSLFRVPMIVRLPIHHRITGQVEEWVSIKDVFHILSNTLHARQPPSNLSTGWPGYSPESSPVWALTHVKGLPPEGPGPSPVNLLSRPLLVCFYRNAKMVLDPQTGEITSTELSPSVEPAPDADRIPLEAIQAEARRIGALISLSTSGTIESVGLRLSGWGYT